MVERNYRDDFDENDMEFLATLLGQLLGCPY